MRFFLAACILVFYSIGLGVSLLPAIVGIAGFWACCGAFVGMWLFVLTSCLFYLEATMANQDGANVASISRKLIGKAGAIISSTAFIYAHNTVLAVYFFFGMHLFNTIITMVLGYAIPHMLLHLLLAFFLGVFLFLGSRWCGLLAALCLFLFIGTLLYVLINAGDGLIIPSFDVDWFYLLFAIPVIYFTIYVQTIMPSLATFMQRDWVKLKKVVFWGAFCGLLVNLLWLCISVSSIPENVISLAFQNYNHIYGSTDFLSRIPAIGNTIYVLLLLAFCASFPLSAIVLLDFYSDLFKIVPEKRTGRKRYCSFFSNIY